MMNGELAASIVGVIGSLLGVALSYWIVRDQRKFAAMARRVERYKRDIKARIAEEEAASLWLVELGVAESTRSAKIKLRDRTQTESGLRPFISPSEID